MIYLLGGYMWLFIHRPFEVWPWLGDLHVERVYMIVTILYWALAADKRWIPNRLNVAFAFFWLVVLASCLLSPFNSNVEDYFKVAVFYVLVITTVRSERDLKFLVTMFLVAMGLYIAHSFREYLCGRSIYRMGIARMVGVDASYNDPNTFSATILYSLPMVFPVWGLAQKPWQRGLLVGYAGLSGLCILLTGSRSAFVGLCFLLIVASLLSKHRKTVLVALAVAAPLVWFSLRADLQNRFLTLVDPSYGPKNAQESAEGRTKGFWDGVRLWKEHPVLGVGPGVFGMATGSGMQAHHLYGQVLGELGTAGAIAFAGVVLAIFANYFELRRRQKGNPDLRQAFPTRVVQAVTLTTVVLLLMGFGGHNLYRYTWLWFGAFQAIALYFIRVAQPATAFEGVPLIDADAAAGVSL